MIKVNRQPAPKTFKKKVLKPGSKFIAKHSLTPGNVPKNFRWESHWLEVRKELKKAFNSRCGYSAMWIPGPGEVDHYISKNKNPSLAYDWENYRFADSTMNKRKGKRDGIILDPFEIGDDWFKVNVFTGKIGPTKNIPLKYLDRVKKTIKHLRLNDRNYKNARREWIEDLIDEKPETSKIDLVRKKAPLVAQAVEEYWKVKRAYLAEVTKE